MKINKSLAALIASAGIGISGQALAAATATDTAAGTVITNEATFSYMVGSQNYTDTSAETTFKVDQKIDLILVWNQSPVTADVGDEFALKIEISNEGNLAQSFKFDSDQSANGTVLTKMTAIAGSNQLDDAESATSWAYYQDGGDNAYTTDGSSDDIELTDGILTNLAIDTDASPEVVTVWAVAKNLNTTVDESKIGVEIRARAWDSSGLGSYLAETDTSGVDNDKNFRLSEQFVVFAEDPEGDKNLILAGGTGNRDGGYVVLTEILVAAPIISIAKSVSVTASDFTLSDGSFVAIPGSTIEYTVTVTNDGTGDASLITVTDPLDDLNYLLDDTIANTVVTFLNVDGSAATTGTDASAESNIAIDASKIYSLDLRLNKKEEATITFDVELL